MTKQALLLQEQALRLDPGERYKLLLALWESLAPEDDVPLTAEEIALIEERFADHRANPNDTIPAEEVHRRLKSRKPA